MVHIIVNKSSRTGKAAGIWSELEEYLKTQPDLAYQAYFTEYGGHATELATKICQENKDEFKLLVVGGDGTANEVVNGITAFDRADFGYVPTGSGNDLGRGLGISGRTPLEQLKHLLDSVDIRKMDLGQATISDGSSRKFTISAGIGLDADVCKQALTSKLKKFLNKIHLGSATYALLTLRTIYTMPFSKGIAKVEGCGTDGKDTKEFPVNGLLFSAAMNFACEGGGVPMAPKADGFDGKLSMVVAHGIPRGLAIFAFLFLLIGKHEKIKGYERIEGDKLTLRLQDKMVIHADGEYVGTESAVTFQVLPQLLRVII